MAKYRDSLPQLAAGSMMLTDGGIETYLIFQQGIDLPQFAACDLLRTESGTRTLSDYLDDNVAVATSSGLPFSIDSPTWRANPDWGNRLGYSSAELEEVNRAGVRMAADVRRRHETAAAPFVIAGVVGPRGDGYRVDVRQTATEAERYHSVQIGVLADTDADYISALTINYSDEAIGIVRAAAAVAMPVVISFTVELDGRLASGETLQEAIETVDAATHRGPVYYGVNCVHPTHLPDELFGGASWAGRVRSFRANASRLSHAELDEAEELDDGDPLELAAQMREVRDRMPQLAVIGGCCGSDSRHISAIAAALIR
jgi:homocysteine S-methyltransferase